MNIINTETEELFNVWLESVKKKDSSYFEVLVKSQSNIKQSLCKFPYKKTVSSLVGLIYKLNFIKNGVVDLCESDNYYSANILYRSFLEHWLKANYIAGRVLKEKTDEVGEDYLIFCNIAEQLDYGESVIKTINMLEIDNDLGNVWEYTTSKFPHLKSLSRDSIQSKALQFKHKNMIKYLIKLKSPESDWIHVLISEYSELSSYVHGGPQANEELSEPDRCLKYKKMISFVCNMSKFYTAYIYKILSEYDENMEYLKLIKKLNKIKNVA